MRKHGIFERSVQDLSQIPAPPILRPHSLLVLLMHLLHLVGRGTGGGGVGGGPLAAAANCPLFLPEDYIPSTLDATALIIADKHTNLDDVEMVYPLRRNSLVVGLSMALGGGRPRGPSRKNLAYLMSQVADNNSVAPPRPLALLSPPKLLLLRLLLNFCSYVDIVQENDDMPQFRTLYSLGYIPKLPQLLHGPTKAKRPLVPGRAPTNNADSLKFMILPELLEGEGDDDDLVVASTLGAHLRHTTTELSLAEH